MSDTSKNVPDIEAISKNLKEDPTDLSREMIDPQRRSIASLQMNRKQRRNFAKRHGLFQDPSRDAWRIGNKHMKGDKQNKTITHKLGDE